MDTGLGRYTCNKQDCTNWFLQKLGSAPYPHSLYTCKFSTFQGFYKEIQEIKV